MLRFIRRRTEGFIAKVVISIHLMLRFIAPDLMHPWLLHIISIHLMLRFIKRKDNRKNCPCYFNTSHVTVYPEKLHHTRSDQAHFNTSHVTVYLRTRCSPFFAQLNFNTSHVTVYRRYNQRPLVSSGHFNTSHVTVYPDVSVIGSVVPTISIHLMLRFICFGLTIANSLSWFQYISCYGLSPDTRRSFWHVDISIHLMLRFITLSGYCK